MMNKRFMAAITAAALMIGAAAPALAQDAKAAAPLDKAAIETIIHDYIMANPKVLMESVQQYGEQQQQNADKMATQEISKNADWLFNNPDHATAGNPKGDVTIVEFFDYSCGYCKQAVADVMKLLDEDKNVRLVFVEIPILGPGSEAAAKWALAAKRQNLYLEYHLALMNHRGPFTEEVFFDLAKKAGLDVEKLKKDGEDPEIKQTIGENLRMAASLGITGTPGFVVNNQLVRGYIPVEEMKSEVAKARAELKEKAEKKD